MTELSAHLKRVNDGLRYMASASVSGTDLLCDLADLLTKYGNEIERLNNCVRALEQANYP